VLPFGSSFEWQLVEGGKHQQSKANADSQETNQDSITYLTSWDVQMLDNTSLDFLDISLIESVEAAGSKQDLDSSSVVRVMCEFPSSLSDMSNSFSYSLVLTQKGKLTKNFLRPKTHHQTINVKCEAPAASKLMWAQQSSAPFLLNEVDELIELPLSRFLNESEIYFVLTNSTHYLKTILTDSQGVAFIDKRSVLASFQLSDQSLATLLPLSNQEIKDANLLGSLLEGELVHKRKMQIGGTPGRVKVTTTSFGYNSSSIEV
jgi:hypothetical protein